MVRVHHCASVGLRVVESVERPTGMFRAYFAADANGEVKVERYAAPFRCLQCPFSELAISPPP